MSVRNLPSGSEVYSQHAGDVAPYFIFVGYRTKLCQWAEVLCISDQASYVFDISRESIPDDWCGFECFDYFTPGQELPVDIIQTGNTHIGFIGDEPNEILNDLEPQYCSEPEGGFSERPTNLLNDFLKEYQHACDVADKAAAKADNLYQSCKRHFDRFGVKNREVAK